MSNNFDPKVGPNGERVRTWADPANDAFAVTADDGQDIQRTGCAPTCLLLGDAGTVTVTTAKGTKLTITIAAAPFVLPLLVKRVWSTGTTCTKIYALVQAP